MLRARAEVTLSAPLPFDPDPVLDEDAIGRAAHLLAKAECPVIFVGGGALDAADEVRALAERLAAPVVSYRRGKGVLDERHPLAHMLPAGHALRSGPMWCSRSARGCRCSSAAGAPTTSSAHQGRHRPRGARPHQEARDRHRRRRRGGAGADRRASASARAHARGSARREPRAQGALGGRGVGRLAPQRTSCAPSARCCPTTASWSRSSPKSAMRPARSTKRASRARSFPPATGHARLGVATALGVKHALGDTPVVRSMVTAASCSTCRSCRLRCATASPSSWSCSTTAPTAMCATCRRTCTAIASSAPTSPIPTSCGSPRASASPPPHTTPEGLRRALEQSSAQNEPR